MSDIESLTIKCPVTIKAKVTEDLKTQLAAEISDNIKRADMELQQIEFQAKRMLTEQAKADAQGLPSLRQQIELEKQKRNEFKSLMVEKLKETANLEIGSEIVQGTIEQLVTVTVGTDLHKVMATEVLLEDGKIIAFRS
jgi:hypothetical protein